MAVKAISIPPVVSLDPTSSIFDAFERLRVVQPTYVFDCQLTYNLQPLLFEQKTNGSGASIAHSSTNRWATMTFSSTPTGGYAYMQAYEYFRYQPGRAQVCVMTFNFQGGVANVLKFVGYSDGTNGVELQLNGTTPQLTIYSSTSAGNDTITQSDWDDKLDGTGPSGITVDWTKTQIFILDIQALYVGIVECALDIGGLIVPFLKREHANVFSYPYIADANKPIRAGMSCTGTVSTTMNFICCSVISNGGQTDQQGFELSIEATGTGGNETRAHILSLRPKTTFNSITNRVKFVLESIDVIVTSGSNPVTLEVVLGQEISGTTTFNDVNSTYSAFEYNTAGTISGSPTIVINTILVSATSSGRPPAAKALGTRYPITLDAAGAVRSLGTLSILATGHTGTSPVRVVLNWREVR